jgi:hypothetical protein
MIMGFDDGDHYPVMTYTAKTLVNGRLNSSSENKRDIVKVIRSES